MRLVDALARLGTAIASWLGLEYDDDDDYPNDPLLGDHE